MPGNVQTPIKLLNFINTFGFKGLVIMSVICSCITVNLLNNTIFSELMKEMEPDVYMFASAI